MPDPAPDPVDATWIALVEQRVQGVLDDERRRWSALDPAVDAPLAALAQLVGSGGKRLRPLFCRWGFIGAGGDPDDPTVLDVGAAFELLHAFALLHDDVMDGSDTRRRRPTVHAAFAAEHESQGWRGEPRRFGEGVAILLGDLAHVFADRLLEGASPATRTLWDELKVEINVGQYLDVVGTARGDTPLDEARRISRYKSGKYTIERPLHVGAALAGRLDDLGGALTAYGDPLGEAFQLRDDVLGAFGDPTVTGKPVGDDLREGKPTPMLAIARGRADAAQRAVLGTAGRSGLDPAGIRAVQAVLVDTGALAEVERTIGSLRTDAIEAVRCAPLEPVAIDALVSLADLVTERAV